MIISLQSKKTSKQNSAKERRMEKRDERKLDAAELERAEEAGRQLKKVEDIDEAMKSFVDGYQAAMETMQRILTAPRTTA